MQGFFINVANLGTDKTDQININSWTVQQVLNNFAADNITNAKILASPKKSVAN